MKGKGEEGKENAGEPKNERNKEMEKSERVHGCIYEWGYWVWSCEINFEGEVNFECDWVVGVA